MLGDKDFYPASMWGGPLCRSCATRKLGHETFPILSALVARQYGRCVECKRQFPEPGSADIDVEEPSWEAHIPSADILDYWRSI